MISNQYEKTRKNSELSSPNKKLLTQNKISSQHFNTNYAALRSKAKNSRTKLYTSSLLNAISLINWSEIKENLNRNLIKEFQFQKRFVLKYSEQEFLKLINDFIKNSLIKAMQNHQYNLTEIKESSLLENNNIKDIIASLENLIYREHYTPLLNFLNRNWQNFQNNSSKFNFLYLNCCKQHNCEKKNPKYNEEKAKHKCGGVFIEIYNDKVKLSYLLCKDCKEIFPPDSIEIICISCQREYLTEYVTSNNYQDEIISHSTWSSYHCDVIMYDKMKCIKCREYFFYSEKRELLICKSCKFEANPCAIVWICIFCKSEFTSKAKIYQSNEYMKQRDTIREVLKAKEIAKPDELPCCKLNPNSLTFIHKKSCGGVLYKGVFDNQPIIACEKCKTVNFSDKYLWSCPNCNSKFKLGQPLKQELNNNNNIKITDSNSIISSVSSIKNTIVATENGSMTSNKKSFKPKTLIEFIEERKQLQKFKSSIHFFNGKKDEEKIPEINDPIENDDKDNINIKKNLIQEINQQKIENIEHSSKLDTSSILLNVNHSTSVSNKINNIQVNQTTIEESYKNDFNVDQFEIIKQIGQGSFGKIFLVKAKDENQFITGKMAMKKLMASNINDIKKIKKELEILKETSHENIMKIFGMSLNFESVSSGFIIYVLMELALTDWNKEIKNRRQGNNFYSEEELVMVLKQIAGCLCYLQKNGITHRDIKPQNILLFEDGIYKIADFGDAKEMTNEDIDKISTLRGTELFMSPILFFAHKNKLKEVKHNSWKSDVFSLGFCIFYAATLTYKSIYDLREIKEQDKIDKILYNYLKIRYTSKFIQIVNKMLQLEEGKRPDFIELENCLNEFNN